MPQKPQKKNITHETTSLNSVRASCLTTLTSLFRTHTGNLHLSFRFQINNRTAAKEEMNNHLLCK